MSNRLDKNPLKRIKELGNKAKDKAPAQNTKRNKSIETSNRKKENGKEINTDKKQEKKLQNKPQSKKQNKQKINQQVKQQKQKSEKQNKSAAKAAPVKEEKNKQKKAKQADAVTKQTIKTEQKTEKKKTENSKPAKKKSEAQKKPEIQKKPEVQVKAVRPAGPLKIIPLGGQEQIGMNMTAFEYGDTIIAVDCGMAFPDDNMPGVDLVIPDTKYLKDNFDKFKGFFITHGHEDHIGALPYVLRNLNVPVYGTKLTLALIQHKLEEAGLDSSAKLINAKYGQTISAGDFEIEFVKTNHSIQDAAALAIHTPVGTVFHTGDFKVDYTPVFGEPADLQRMAAIGHEGCLVLMCDSTNAIKPGFTMSEKTVGVTFDRIFAEHKDNRIIVATFASNGDRVQQIINSSIKYGRKVVIEGRSMINVIGTANDLGYINIPEGTLIDIEQIKNYRPEDTVIITTGSQGESMAALSRMAASTHKKVSISQGDVIIMSSSPIPGNEKAVSKIVNELTAKGAEVILSDTHVSGHACAEDIKLIYSLLKPKFAIPVHGEFRHLMAQKEIALSLGIPNENIMLMSSGDVIEVTKDTVRSIDHVEVEPVMIDGLGVGDVQNVVLKDRQNLAQNGIVVVTVTLDMETKSILAGPEILNRGFIFAKEAEEFMNEAQMTATKAIEKCFDNDIKDRTKMRNTIKDDLGDLIWRTYKKRPIILPIIMQVEV